MSIADKITTLNTIKNDIKQAIIDKGVEVTSETPFTDYANKIGEISGGGGKIDVAAAGLKFGYSKELVPELDFSKCTDFDHMFEGSTIQDFSMVDSGNATSMGYCFYNYHLKYPPLNTSKVTNMSYCLAFDGGRSEYRSIEGLSSWDVSKVKNFTNCFYYRSYLNDGWLDEIKDWDVSSANRMYYMFAYANRYSGTGYGHSTDYSVLNGWDTSNVTDMSSCFYYNAMMTVAPAWNTRSVGSFSSMFSGCTNLTSIPSYDASSITSTTNANLFTASSSNQPKNATSFGGLIGTKYGYNVQYMTNLTVESLMNIINGLYDFSDGTPHTTANTTMTLGATNLAKLTDAQKAVATSKGWTLK